MKTKTTVKQSSQSVITASILRQISGAELGNKRKHPTLVLETALAQEDRGGQDDLYYVNLGDPDSAHQNQATCNHGNRAT